MATVSRGTKSAGGTDFTSNTNALASEVNTDLNNLINAHNNHDSGTSKWSVVSAFNASAVPLIADNSSGSTDVAQFKVNGTTQWNVTSTGVLNSNSKKITGIANGSASTDVPSLGQLANLIASGPPRLTFINVTTVDVENNTGTANQTTIVFPDGVALSVTEDTSSTNKYRRFDITAAANFVSGTEDSGIRSGITEATNTTYYIYAVKSQINTANFVLSGDTTAPTQANFATLNTRYGTNSWVYLGFIRNGDGSSSTGDILNFVWSGGWCFFKNTAVAIRLFTTNGYYLANTASAATLTYSVTTGTGTTDIPDTADHAVYSVTAGNIADRLFVEDAGANTRFLTINVNSQNSLHRIPTFAGAGIKLSNGLATAVAYEIVVVAINDRILSRGVSHYL